MCQLKKKPIQCIMGFYIDLAGIAGGANCICKHERLRILLFHCKYQLDIKIIRVTQLCVMYITLSLLDCGDDDMCTFPA
jgi:hypothetical protein